jgi:hypothetical protein
LGHSHLAATSRRCLASTLPAKVKAGAGASASAVA